MTRRSDLTPAEVTVEWARPMPDVRGYCQRCRRDCYGDVNTAFAVVSPTGLAHIGTDYGDTACGIDATGPDWWWRL